MEFAVDSNKFFESVLKHEHKILITDALKEELVHAPKEVKKILVSLKTENLIEIYVTEEVLLLRDAYIKAGIVRKSSSVDATHIAAATVFGAHVPVSWNFHDIVNLDKIRKYNAVNSLNEYSPIDIRSPKEMIVYE